MAGLQVGGEPYFHLLWSSLCIVDSLVQVVNPLHCPVSRACTCFPAEDMGTTLPLERRACPGVHQSALLLSGPPRDCRACSRCPCTRPRSSRRRCSSGWGGAVPPTG